jgi:hypothetical protein
MCETIEEHCRSEAERENTEKEQARLCWRKRATAHGQGSFFLFISLQKKRSSHYLSAIGLYSSIYRAQESFFRLYVEAFSAELPMFRRVRDAREKRFLTRHNHQ